MTIVDASLEEMEAAVRPNKRSTIRCRQARTRTIRALFPAWHLLTSRDHIHLSNPCAAFEYNKNEELEARLQAGFCYVFRATWESEAYELPDGRTALSMEQIFDADVERYRFHPRSLHCFERDGVPGRRHRWNGHNGSLEVVMRLSESALCHMAESMARDTVLLVKKSGPYAGLWDLPKGVLEWRVTPKIG